MLSKCCMLEPLQRSQGFQSNSDSLRQLPALHLRSRLDLSSHLLLSICCYVIRGYVAPSCILHGIFYFIIHDNPHDAYTSAHYTHAHACIDETACMHSPLHCIALLFTCSCYTTDCLLTLGCASPCCRETQENCCSVCLAPEEICWCRQQNTHRTVSAGTWMAVS